MGKYSGIWGEYCVFMGQLQWYSRTNTVVFGANTVVFLENTMVIWAKTVVFEANTVVVKA